MKQVEFERVESALSGYGVRGVARDFSGAEEIIERRIESGWDFAGYVPLRSRGSEGITYISLVFTRDAADEDMA